MGAHLLKIKKASKGAWAGLRTPERSKWTNIGAKRADTSEKKREAV